MDHESMERKYNINQLSGISVQACKEESDVLIDRKELLHSTWILRKENEMKPKRGEERIIQENQSSLRLSNEYE